MFWFVLFDNGFSIFKFELILGRVHKFVELVNIESFHKNALHVLFTNQLSLDFPVYDVEQFKLLILIEIGCR